MVKTILGGGAAARLVLAAAGACALAACGQKGPLFLPAEPAAAGRASLPQTLRPGTAAPATAAPAAQPAASGVQPPSSSR